MRALRSQSCSVMQRKLHTQCASPRCTTGGGTSPCNVAAYCQVPCAALSSLFPESRDLADGGQETPGIGHRRFRVVSPKTSLPCVRGSNLRFTPLISTLLDTCSPGRPDNPRFCRSTHRLAIFLFVDYSLHLDIILLIFSQSQPCSMYR